ncbi:hypothetical protein OV208_18190 [Corallococcus sp. bb12-1]|uniref:hypothetical protein n=1 Tax=Corallococcus sp. bb12-1 TaxID=2996784 RepID=UPI00226F71D0|nr:hypothetical protein [Corallococcus sp. bb12-1]MCY1043253.1 hypothetical protein [Corallococcus sp. bb12-1]
MQVRLSLFMPLLVIALFGATPARAADESPIPEGCVEKSYCDGVKCYAPEDPKSQLACACGLLNPVCGVGRCSEGSYCEGTACGGDASFCHPASSPVSQVMCGGASMGDSCDLPPTGCGQGSCSSDGAYCDACGCQPLDSAPSQALCECKLADPKAGVGTCVDGAYCDDLTSDKGHCYPADADVSQAMCNGATLKACKAPAPSSDPGTCKDGSYCVDGQCHEVDSAMSKTHCAVSSVPQDTSDKTRGLAAMSFGPYDVGVIPKKNGCPAGSEFIQIYMDDEDNNNANYNWGWIGATQQSGNGTRFGFCRVDGTKFRPLHHGWNTDLRKETYSVLKLGSVCPLGSMEFIRYFDNEDRNNANWRSGNLWPNASNSNTTLRFCMFMPSTNYFMPGFPSLGMEYGVFAASNYPSAYWLAAGFVHTDDEDRNNANWFSYNNNGNPGILIHAMIWGGANTDMRIAKVANGPAPCTKKVPYWSGGLITPWFDGANCFIKNVPPYGTPFTWANNYYVSPGWNNSCIEGGFDGANCYIMSAPAGTTAFKWGNGFYYAE